MNLLKNIRFYVLLFSLFFSLGVYIFITQTIPAGNLQIIRLTQIYALTALTFLYLAVVAGPLTYIFPQLPFRGLYMKARRAIGFSAFFFGLLHGSFAFFGQLGGFGGLPFLSGNYLLAIGLSFTALLILSLMAATSFDLMVSKLGFARWKLLHRFVYLVVFLITVHALMLGTHFTDLSGIIPQIFLSALAILLLLEANRFDAFLERKLQNSPSEQQAVKPTQTHPRCGPTLIVTTVIVVWYFLSSLGLTSLAQPSLGIHSLHLQLAKEAQQQTITGQSNNSGPSYLQGDRTKRFSVSFLHPDKVEASKDATLRFLVNDASNGVPVNFFSKVYEKPLHLIIVDINLKYFNHLHPEQIVDGFSITTQFPHAGIYHLYQDFQPVGAIEQQFAFSLPVGTSTAELAPAPSSTGKTKFIPDTNLTKTFGDYSVNLKFPQPLRSSEISVGAQKLTFTIADAKTNKPVTNLKPYLASFGHLVMINTQTFDYIHVHPANLTVPPPDDSGGPQVEFLPLGLYGPIKPGIYRLFAQFNPDDKLFTADFTIQVE